MVAATSSIVLSDIDVSFFFQNITVKHRDLYRAYPKLNDLTTQDIIAAYNPRVVRKSKITLKVVKIIWALLTATPDFEAPARKVTTIRSMLKTLCAKEFNPVGSMFDDGSTSTEWGGYAPQYNNRAVLQRAVYA